MAVFIKVLGISLAAAVISQVVEQKAMTAVLLLGACIAAAILAMELLRPLTELFSQVQGMTSLPGTYLEILLKVLAVGISSELSAELCKEAGAGALGKIVRFSGAALILNVTLPVYTQLLELLQNLMGGL